MTVIHNHRAYGDQKWDSLYGRPPEIIWGTAAPDGDAAPWKDAQIGTVYIRVSSGNVGLHLKEADDEDDNDWLTVTTS